MARFQISDIIEMPRAKPISGGYSLCQLQMRNKQTVFVIFDPNGFPVNEPLELRRIEMEYSCKLKPIWLGRECLYGAIYKRTA